MTEETTARKRKLGLCITPFCRRKARAHRSKCNTCRSREYDKPLARAWRNLKISAKRRHKEFAIPKPCFLLWCAMNHFSPDGKKANSLTIDRKFPKIGYLFANMQPLPNWENAQKQ